ncbi:MAG: hypothetical protein K2R98_07190 [Gemmataceae bacterium]|nr:hypothetical protein [Gemmataceae bacterium]
MPSCSSVLSYRKHKSSGQAIVTLADGFGGRRDVLLGKHGTKESRIEYARVIAEWEAAGRRLPRTNLSSDLTINELILAFWQHVEQSYRKQDGTPSLELDNAKYALRTLCQLYEHTAASAFGPRALKAVQLRMAEQDLCRNTIMPHAGPFDTWQGGPDTLVWPARQECLAHRTQPFSTARSITAG